MKELKEGMYVRCPVDLEDQENPRKFILGQIIDIDKTISEASVFFHDLENGRKYFRNIPKSKKYDFEKIERCRILKGSKVLLKKNNKGKIIYQINKDKNGFYKYYIQEENDSDKKNQNVRAINEKQIKVQFTRGDSEPLEQLKNYEFHNPIWYKKRKQVSNAFQSINNSAFGFEVLLGSRVHLLPHQVDTVVRGINEDPCRLMLADEVGLGKTIEASVIMKGLKEKKNKLKTLIITPDSLVHQWQNELSYKFWTDVPIYGKDIKKFEIPENMILPLDQVDTLEGMLILKADWDLVIIDETHRLLGMEKTYNDIYELSKRTDNLLLLTATPIQQRINEYLKLLSLLKPNYYGQMKENEFEKLLDKQLFVRSKVYQMMRDLEDFYELNLAEDYLYDLKEVEEELDDEILAKIIKKIDLESEDEGLKKIKLALEYLGEYYQIERNIIRHRRLQLKEKLPKRTLYEIDYEAAGSDYGFFEVDVYEELLEYLKAISSNNDYDVVIGEYIKTFLSAVFSSPWALKAMIKERKRIVNENKYSEDKKEKIYMMNTPRKEVSRKKDLLASLEPLENEEQILEDLLSLNNLWEEASNNEFNRLEELYNNPHLIKGRLMQAIDYLSQELDSTKYVIFTSWPETLKKFEKIVANKFGPNSYATFHCGKNKEELQKAADKFQSDKKCRFMICDELGGEGRNFQIADGIIHLDLPWSPIKLEQRIGRLDRVGRQENKEVTSVAFYSQETIEEELFKLWDEGLNVFNQSLSGLEIVLQELQQKVSTALASDLKYGLADTVKNIKEYSQKMMEAVEEEQYFDMARHIDENLEYQLNKLIDRFSENSKESLHDIMMSWANLSGLRPDYEGGSNKIIVFKPQNFSINSIRNTLLIPPNMEEARKRAKRSGEIRGTFSREKAIEREDLIFFAPGDPFFDSIIDNAIESNRGKVCSFVQLSDLEWRGFVFSWSVNLDILPLIQSDNDINFSYLGQGYMPLDNLVTLEPLTKEDEEIERESIFQRLDKSYSKNMSDFFHLGKRSKKDKIIPGDYINNLNWFKDEFPLDFWQSKVNEVYDNSYNKVLKKLDFNIDLERAKNDFERKLSGIKASSLYYDKEDDLDVNYDKMRKVYNEILKGIKEPKIELDSIAFVWMVKQ
jgi:ATP-dependent helicase HepA